MVPFAGSMVAARASKVARPHSRAPSSASGRHQACGHVSDGIGHDADDESEQVHRITDRERVPVRGVLQSGREPGMARPGAVAQILEMEDFSWTCLTIAFASSTKL